MVLWTVRSCCSTVTRCICDRPPSCAHCVTCVDRCDGFSLWLCLRLSCEIRCTTSSRATGTAGSDSDKAASCPPCRHVIVSSTCRSAHPAGGEPPSVANERANQRQADQHVETKPPLLF